MLEYGIGLDIGVASVGWAIVALDAQEMPCGIIRMGSRVFDEAEHPKTGDSLAAPRRAARSARRRLRRHRHRNERIRHLLVSGGVVSEETLETLFQGKLEDIYTLRVRALDELLNEKELTRLLIHLAQRRGFRSNRKKPSTKEDGQILEAVNKNKAEMAQKGYRTVGEMLLRDPRFEENKRNKGGSYIATVSRDQIEDEVRLIFAAQRRLGSKTATEKLEQDYLDILLSQRSFDEGPGGNSPYGGSQIEKMVGRCTFLPENKRAAKATYSFEYFNLLEKLNHIRLQKGGSSTPLDAQQREAIIRLAHDSESVDYAKIRKTLGLPENVRFNTVRYKGDDAAACEKGEKLGCLRAYHQMRKAFDKVSKGYIKQVSREHRNAIATALTLYKTSARIRGYLEDAGVPELLIGVAENMDSFSKFGHLSVQACDAIIPHLEKGMNYSDACTAAGFRFQGHDGDKRDMLLHPKEADYEDLTSPVVRRAVAQTIKVVNAIIRRQGRSPMFINVEVAREMAKDFKERKKLESDMKSNQAANERIMETLRKEFGLRSPSGQDLVKYKLWKEQDGVCPYSQRHLSIERLFEPNYAEVDHIVPYSLSFDDSYRNKVLVFAGENRNKSNRLPLQYLTGDRRDKFIVWVNSSIRDYRKRQLLLKEAITKEDEERFRERNLQDTKTASRFILNYLNDNLLFATSATGKKKRVTAVNGAVTSYMRKRWGIQKIRANGDVHHAVDALVVACTTNGMIQQISRYAAFRECEYSVGEGESFAVDSRTGEVLRSFPHPWPQFRKELEGHLSSDPRRFLADQRLPMYVSGVLQAPEHPIFVSRMPHRKVTGAAHKDTVKSPKLLDQGKVLVKRPLQELKLKDGEIEGYFAPESDRLLYEALLAQLKAFGGDGKKAFAEPFHKPKSDGTPGPVVKKVKVWEKATLGVSLHGGRGVAANESMVRVDVFHVEDDGYYLVPIYVADTLCETLPNRACVAAKPYEEWREMREEDFVFSLYPNDLVRITGKKEIVFTKIRKESDLPETVGGYSVLGYYRGTNIFTASISCITHDNTHERQGIGVKTLLCIEKYSVDILGDYHRVQKEKRESFHQKRG